MTKRPSSIHNDPGYFYNRKLLLRIFTFSSLLFFVGITWWIWDDFDRAWKHDQRHELRWEAGRFAVERFVLENLAQADEAKYRKELAEGEKQVAARKAEIEAIDAKLKDANGAFYLDDMTYKEQKQYTSEAEYWVQEAATETELADWWYKLRFHRDREDRLRDAREMADANLQMLLDRKKALEAEVDAVHAEMRKNPDLKRLEIVRQNIQKKKSYNPAREIPLLDFLAPPVKVKQIVLDNLVDNYEFSMPKKVDRCATCHILSTEVGYDAARWPVEAIDKKDPRAFEEGVYRFVYAVFDSVDPGKPAPNAPFRRELELQRKARLHADTLNFLCEMEDEDTGEIELDKEKNKVWRKYKRDEAGHWEEDAAGSSVANYYVAALKRMKPHWRTHSHFKDMVGSGSPHPFEKFGCSGCHQGRGWSTDFGLAYHMPDLERIENWMTDERAHEEGYHIPLSAGQTFRAAMAQGAPPESAVS